MASVLRTGGIRRLSARAPQSSSRAYLVIYTCGARSCGSWGRRRVFHEHEEDKRQARKAEVPEAQEGSSRHDPSLKEKIWRQRMDAIRRMIDEDPYEALFGWSNRLRRGQRGFAPPRWLHQEFEYLRVSPTARSEEHPKTDFPKKVEITSEANRTAAKSNDNVNPAEKPPSSPLPQDNSPKSSNEAISEEPILEYDPISNRMVPKGDKIFSHYGQDLDAAVDVPVKPYRPSEPKEEPSPIPRQTPTFTMLKEEPVESQPSPRDNLSKVQSSPSDVRSEYKRYMARRLPESTMSRDAWLVNEGFLNKPTINSTNNEKLEPHNLPALNTERARLEDKFDEAHSAEKELAQEKLLGEKPGNEQASKSTSILQLEKKVEELYKRRESQKTEEVRARKELEQHDQHLFNENSNNNRMRNTKDKKYIDLQEKVNEIRARREILEYNLNVARENLGKEQAKATIARMDRFVNGVPILEPLWKAISPTLVEEDHGRHDSSAKIETSLQRHKNNTESKSSTLQTAMDRHNRTTREAIDTPSQDVHDQPPRTHDPIGYNHARESRKTNEYETKPVGFEGEKATHRAHLRSRIAEIEARFEESQQRLRGTSRIVIRSNAPSRTDQRHTEIFKGSMRHVPSLAEMHGYKKDGATPKAQAGVVDAKAAKRIEAEEALLRKEVEKQKYAMMQAERKNVPSNSETVTPLVSPEQKPATSSKVLKDQTAPDVELVRTIRSIYESTYGQITTKHRQEEERAIPDPVVVNVSKPTVNEEPTTQEIQLTPILEKVATAPTPAPAASEDTPPVTYTILAYDAQAQQVTRATLSAPPSGMPETPIPLTIALKGLHAPAKFLHHLSALKDSGFTPISAEKNLLILKHIGDLPIPIEKPIDIPPIATEQVPLSSSSDAPKQEEASRDISSSGVNKLEPVFSGRNFTRTKEDWRRLWWENHNRRRARKRRAKRFLKSMALVGGVGVATLYAAGVMAEMKKVTIHDRREG
jgi:hypothetical protein